MKAEELSKAFAAGLTYQDYLKTGAEEQQRRWTQVYQAAKLTNAQAAMVDGFVREMNLLIISGIWCGDCVEQCPLAQRIAEANPAKIHLRLVDRDQHKDLSQQFRINAGDRVPVMLLMAEDFELCSAFGDRGINRYRALAQKRLGAACPTGIVGPDKAEMAATLADWLAEIERVQLMLRLSNRLRQKYND